MIMTGLPFVVSTKEIASINGDGGIKIIDARSSDAYNGWKLAHEPRGGHIPGAKSLPFKWTSYIDWIEIVRQKGILPEHKIIVYAYSINEADAVAHRFIDSGYSDVSVYPAFTSDWLSNENLPLEYLPRYKNLVPAEWLKKLLDGGNPPEYTNNRYVLLHAHYRNRNAYLSGHIPGATDIDTLDLESSETWNRRSPDELKKAFEKHGVTSDTTVVLYGKYMHPDNNDPFPGSAAGDIGAMRCAFIMLYAGVKDVRILNGGFQSWEDAGYDISTVDEYPRPIGEFGSVIPKEPWLAVDTPEAKEILKSEDAELVCVRSWPEYIGEVSGYNYIEPKGRIPGAIFADCGSDAYHMENYRNLDLTTREYHEISDIWTNNGITPVKHLAFYCGTGWRGSEAWFNAWLMGWPRVSVYDGGWFEWSADPGNPFETGPR